MSLTVKKRSGNGNLFPRLVNDFFNTESFFGPSILDFEGNLLNREDLVAMPEANIIEHDKNFKIELAAPGLEKKDFKVEVQDGVLSISAEKEHEKKEENKNFKRREFTYNSFARSFTLPENCMSDKIEAKYESGILHLSLPKNEMTISKPAKEIKVS